MTGGFNPLADIASILGSIAKALPTLPAPPPFPLPPSPEVEPPKIEPPSARSDGYVDVTDPLVERQMERYRAEQAAKGIILFHYE